MKDTIIAQVIRSFDIRKGMWKGARIVITAKAYSLGGQAPHFAVGADIGTKAQLQRNDPQCCGCCHEECLEAWPQIKPLIDLHLSDAITGAPMHAESNGWYWMTMISRSTNNCTWPAASTAWMPGW